MPFYQYYGRDGAGIPVQGRLKAPTTIDAREKLEKKQIYVKEVLPLEGWLYQDIKLFQRTKAKDLVLFLRQMATLLEAGISLVDSVRLLRGQIKNKLWKEALAAVEEDIRSGTPFSEAAEKQRHIFPPLMTNMVRAGEAGGSLDDIMERLAISFEKQYRLKQKVLSALSYPLILAAASIGVVVFLLAVVVPTFAVMFSGFGAELPWITQFVLSAGSIASQFWWVVVLFALVFPVSMYAAKRNRTYRYWKDYVLLRLPVIGSILRKAALARMSRTWSSLFSSSVPILHATSIVERIVGNEVLASVIRDSKVSLEKGESLAVPMENHWIFPPLVTQMVAVGEETGALDQMFAKVADYYEEEVDQSTDRMKSMLEPVLIAVLAVVVGVIVAAIAVPMFEVFDTIQ
ncbi:type II secretion system F family protein [Alkalicoccus halolimnae]|uniref:Type II secretion system F family protein n=1 Tax=Alkalicoccus halolimnae TaxID=1667239 RepID=A0A5C7F593_9BACI|nr:type II secretion system F family protein [Alkalicoccus halolimnae]TXF85831.1 type II secretion system F family protein [Alkalicoccus halolimnae]